MKYWTLQTAKSWSAGGDYILVRPDPQVIWSTGHDAKEWKQKNGHYHRSVKGGGQWEFFDLPNEWAISYRELTFHLKPFSFKHTGLFPEQAVNWDWCAQKIRAAREKDPGQRAEGIKSVRLYRRCYDLRSKCRCKCPHVDASKGMVTWAKENAVSSNIPGDKIRWLVDDCAKFVEREIRRGNFFTMASSWIRHLMEEDQRARSGRSKKAFSHSLN